MDIYYNGTIEVTPNLKKYILNNNANLISNKEFIKKKFKLKDYRVQTVSPTIDSDGNKIVAIRYLQDNGEKFITLTATPNSWRVHLMDFSNKSRNTCVYLNLPLEEILEDIELWKKINLTSKTKEERKLNMQKTYRIEFGDRTSLFIKDCRDLKTIKLSLDRFTIFKDEYNDEILVNTASIRYIEEIKYSG